MVVVHQTSADVGSGNSHAYIAERGDGCPHPVGQGPPIQGYSPIWTLRSAALVIRLTSLTVCLHMLTILPWACFYRWNCFPTWESAIYFSAASYSTVGASDLVLPRTWRTLCPIESIVGVLMCGLSASFLFAIVTSLIRRDTGAEREEVHADSTSSLALAGKPGQQNGLGPLEKIESSAGLSKTILTPSASTGCQ
jgi:hypothetical protein